MEKRPPREHMRPIRNLGVGEKKFKKTIETRKRVDPTRLVHPLMVITDLKRGSIKSLGRYLAKHKGIPDREVALELRKLISGSRQRTPYRIIVVEHPDTPKGRGGRPSAKVRVPTPRERQVVSELARLKRPGSVESAVAAIAEMFNITPGTVYKYVKRVAEYDELFADH